MIKSLLLGIIIFLGACSINNEYEIKTTINNEQHTTYFFKTWEGYGHPVRPVDPITYQEAQNFNVYYQVTFKAINGTPRLIFFKKIKLIKSSVEFINKKVPQVQGEYYFQIDITGTDNIILVKQVELLETIELKTYAHLLIDKKGKVILSEVITKEIPYLYEYSYDSEGLLLQAIIKGKNNKTNIIDCTQFYLDRVSYYTHIK